MNCHIPWDNNEKHDHDHDTFDTLTVIIHTQKNVANVKQAVKQWNITLADAWKWCVKAVS